MDPDMVSKHWNLNLFERMVLCYTADMQEVREQKSPGLLEQPQGVTHKLR